MDETRLSNWTTEDGKLCEAAVRVYPGGEGIYDVECQGNIHGIEINRKDIDLKYASICNVVNNEVNEKLRSIAEKGDILVQINSRTVLHEELEEVLHLLDEASSTNKYLKLKFIRPSKITVASFLDRLNLQDKSSKDIYGFHRTVEYLNAEKTFLSCQGALSTIRDLEWVEYLKSIGGPENLKPAGIFKPSKDLKLLCRRGIPAAFRPLLWQKLSQSTLVQQQYPENYYQQLVKRAQQELPKEVADDIEKDVDRTFPEHDFFCSGSGCTSMRRMLRALAVHNPSIGYCQSLNFLAGTMVLFMEEEAAFWLLLTVVERMLPKDYYTKSMVGTYCDQFVLSHIVKKKLPDVHSAVEDAQLQLPLITVQWFMCLFINTLRTEVALRVWDMFLNEGSKVLFRVAVALLKMHQSELLDANDPGEMFKVMRSMGMEIVDADVLVAAAYPHSFNLQSPTALNRNYRAGHRPFSNPRLGFFTKQGNVPNELVGIGLAHIGPVNLSSASNCSDDSSAAADIELKPSDFASPGKESPGKEQQPSIPSNSELPLSPEENSDNAAKLNNKSPTTPHPHDSNHASFTDIFHSTADTRTRDSSSASNTKKSILSRNKYHNPAHEYQRFKKADIERWRAEFRPELELRFRQMEHARAQWQTDRDSLIIDCNLAVSEDLTGTPSPKASARRSTFRGSINTNLNLGAEIGADRASTTTPTSSHRTPQHTPRSPKSGRRKSSSSGNTPDSSNKQEKQEERSDSTPDAAGEETARKIDVLGAVQDGYESDQEEEVVEKMAAASHVLWEYLFEHDDIIDEEHRNSTGEEEAEDSGKSITVKDEEEVAEVNQKNNAVSTALSSITEEDTSTCQTPVSINTD